MGRCRRPQSWRVEPTDQGRTQQSAEVADDLTIPDQLSGATAAGQLSSPAGASRLYAHKAVCPQRRLPYGARDRSLREAAWPKSPKRNEAKGSEGSWMS